MKQYMLISVFEREILTEKFDSFEEAHAQMMEEFFQYGELDPQEFTDEEYQSYDGEYGYGRWSAYVNDGVNSDNYDWLIVYIGDDREE